MSQNVQKTGILCLCLLACLCGLLDASQGDRQTITTGSLFEEMVDMTQLARFPQPAFRTVQFSSYDRRSDLPGGPNWFANSDGFGGEPIPNFQAVLKAPNAEGIGEYLVADVEGPGAIVRVWTAAIAGDIRMYLDGSDTPIYEGPADQFFHRPYDHFESIKDVDKDRFDRTVYQRDASYAPIPFAKHLRIVWTGNTKQIHFYELQVRLYDQEDSVTTFSPSDIHVYRKTIDKVTLKLADPDADQMSPSSQTAFLMSLPPDKAETAVRLEGSQAIQQLTLQLVAEDLDRALRILDTPTLL